jgi:hypothetical protein
MTDIEIIKVVLGSMTTEQQNDINYNYNNTNVGINRDELKSPSEEKPLEVEDEAVWYNRTKNVR